MVIGIDEVGRGAWAGPVAVGAVMLGDSPIEGLTDSKKLTVKKRQELLLIIQRQARQAAIGWVSARQLDQIGMTAALTLAIERALAQLTITPDDQIIIDGTFNFLHGSRYASQTSTLKQADLVVPSVSAASVLAKVARDAYMARMAEHFPAYGFAAHVGYGTKRHMEAITATGPSPLHRRSFAPIKQLIATPQRPVMTSGQRAEEEAAQYLENQGFTILARNWKTKWCEIDIVASKDGRLVFAEVKYRASDGHGEGLAYVTPKKQRQMRFSAEMWLHRHSAELAGATGVSLAAISLSGRPPSVDTFIPQL